jgi:hypothetical protein
LAMQAQQPVLALFYAQRGLRQVAANEDLLLVKAHALFLLERHADSKAYLQRVLARNPQHQTANFLIQQPWAKAVE